MEWHKLQVPHKLFRTKDGVRMGSKSDKDKTRPKYFIHDLDLIN